MHQKKPACRTTSYGLEKTFDRVGVMNKPRHLRGTPVAVLVGDGLDAATPCYSDVAVEKAEVNANHRHPAA